MLQTSSSMHPVRRKTSWWSKEKLHLLQVLLHSA